MTHDDSVPARPGPLHEEAATDSEAADTLESTAEQARGTSRGDDYPETRSADELARGAERGARQEDFGREGS